MGTKRPTQCERGSPERCVDELGVVRPSLTDAAHHEGHAEIRAHHVHAVLLIDRNATQHNRARRESVCSGVGRAGGMRNVRRRSYRGRPRAEDAAASRARRRGPTRTLNAAQRSRCRGRRYIARYKTPFELPSWLPIVAKKGKSAPKIDVISASHPLALLSASH